MTTTTQAPALWYTRCPVPTASGIAQNRRWLHASFAEVGVRLDSVISSSDRAVRESHFRHSLPGSFREGGNVPPIWTRSRGQDTVVVAITWVDEQQLVLVRPDSGLRSVEDLRGRRIGLPRQADSELVDVGRAESLRGLTTALRLAGVPRDAVEWVDVRAPEWDLREPDPTRPPAPARHLLVDALLAGDVDAVFLKGTSSVAALDEGLVPVLDLNEQPDPMLRISAGSPRPVTVDRATLAATPELVDRYLAVLLRTAEWARRHPDEVVGTIAAETGADEQTVRRAFGPDLHLAFEPTLGDTVVDALRDQKDWLLAEGFIADDVDLDAWIDPTVLDRARPLAATLRLGTEEPAGAA